MHYLIIAKAPYEKELVQSLAPNKSIIALDGAANHLQNVIPDYILGDFDSISQEVEKKYRKLGVEFIQIKDQECTDMEKAIRFAKEKGAKSISICCALGGERTDHTLCNFSILKALYAKECPILLHTSKEIIRFLKDEKFYFEGAIGDFCAFIGWPKAKVTSSGLVWDVKEWNTEIGGAISTSNQLKSDKVEIVVKGEILLVYPRE